jgi:hypothetical protein
MSRIHYVPVPESDTEIIEEVTYRRKTMRGMKIKREQAPMEQPLLISDLSALSGSYGLRDYGP